MSWVRCCGCYVNPYIPTIGRVHVAPGDGVTLHGALHRRQIEVAVSGLILGALMATAVLLVGKGLQTTENCSTAAMDRHSNDHALVWWIWKQRNTVVFNGGNPHRLTLDQAILWWVWLVRLD